MNTIVQDDPAFQDLTARLRDGSDEAFEEVLREYSPYVIRSIRRSIDRRMRGRFDSQDFEQAVWMTVHRHRDRLAECESPDNLIAMLVTIAQRKVRFEYRRQAKTAKHDISRERSMQNDSFEEPLFDQTYDQPSQLMIAREQWDLMMEDEPERYREMMILRREGLTFEEIAEKVGVHERTVRRVIQRLAAKLEE